VEGEAEVTRGQKRRFMNYMVCDLNILY